MTTPRAASTEYVPKYAMYASNSDCFSKGVTFSSSPEATFGCGCFMI